MKKKMLIGAFGIVFVVCPVLVAFLATSDIVPYGKNNKNIPEQTVISAYWTHDHVPFADTAIFEVLLAADSRDVDPESVRFVPPSRQGFEINSMGRVVKQEGRIISVSESFRYRCLSCISQAGGYVFDPGQAIFTERGLGQTQNIPSPALFITSRLVGQDLSQPHFKPSDRIILPQFSVPWQFIWAFRIAPWIFAAISILLFLWAVRGSLASSRPKTSATITVRECAARIRMVRKRLARAKTHGEIREQCVTAYYWLTQLPGYRSISVPFIEALSTYAFGPPETDAIVLTLEQFRASAIALVRTAEKETGIARRRAVLKWLHW